MEQFLPGNNEKYYACLLSSFLWLSTPLIKRDNEYVVKDVDTYNTHRCSQLLIAPHGVKYRAYCCGSKSYHVIPIRVIS